MANSKHAHLRYNILDHCFRNKSFEFKDLLDYINEKIAEVYPGEGISTRTLREDLKLFRDKVNGFGAPLPDNIRILRYSNPNFTIAQKPLLPDEQYLIEAASQLLERYENHPKYDKLAEALITFQEEEQQEVHDIDKILFYDHNEEYKGIRLLKPLYLVIKKKQVIQVIYQGFNDKEPKVFEFHPYVLKQYNRRWFVFGLNKTRNKKEWSIPLDDRLIDFNILEGTNYLESDTDWDILFRSRVGVTKPEGAVVEHVVLRFYNGRGKYFKTKPFHPDFDEFIENGKQDQVFFETIINQELVQQLLSYGKDVEVLEPESLKNKMKEQAETMQKYYG